MYLLIYDYTGYSLLSMDFSLVVVNEGYSLLQCTRFSRQWLLLWQGTGSRCAASVVVYVVSRVEVSSGTQA